MSHTSWGVPYVKLREENVAANWQAHARELARAHGVCCGCSDDAAISWRWDQLTERTLSASDVIYVAAVAAAAEGDSVLGVVVIEQLKGSGGVTTIYLRGYVSAARLHDVVVIAAGTPLVDRLTRPRVPVRALAPHLFRLAPEIARLSVVIDDSDRPPARLFLYDASTSPTQPMPLWHFETSTLQRLEHLRAFRRVVTCFWELETSTQEDFERDRASTHMLALAFSFSRRRWYVRLEARVLALLLRMRFRTRREQMQLVRLNGYDEARAQEAADLANWIVQEMSTRLDTAMLRAAAYLEPRLHTLPAALCTLMERCVRAAAAAAAV